MTGACDYGVYEFQRGIMGYEALRTNASGTQRFGDFITTGYDASNGGQRGPEQCVVRRNVFINEFRHGPDGTGGFVG